MTETTRNGFEEISTLIEYEKKQPPRVFPYTTRELAEMYGMSNSTVSLFLHKQGLISKGKRWFYRHNEPKHE